MTYGFDKEVTTGFDFDEEEIYKKAVNAVLDEEGCPYEAEVNLIITDDEEIRKINLEQRGIDAPTDVLSFPMTQYEMAGDFSDVENKPDCFNIETGELLLGDIVISADRVIAQAEEYGHGKRREYAFLIVHSMLHLIGYDHIEDEDRAIMEAKQRTIMDDLNISR